MFNIIYLDFIPEDIFVYYSHLFKKESLRSLQYILKIGYFFLYKKERNPG